MNTTKPTRTPEETRAVSRLRALGQGIKVFCLDQDKHYCVPSASGDGSVYQVQVSGETMLCSCPAGVNDKCCKHVGAVEMYRGLRSSWRRPRPWPSTSGCMTSWSGPWKTSSRTFTEGQQESTPVWTTGCSCPGLKRITTTGQPHSSREQL